MIQRLLDNGFKMNWKYIIWFESLNTALNFNREYIKIHSYIEVLLSILAYIKSDKRISQQLSYLIGKTKILYGIGVKNTTSNIHKAKK